MSEGQEEMWMQVLGHKEVAMQSGEDKSGVENKLAALPFSAATRRALNSHMSRFATISVKFGIPIMWTVFIGGVLFNFICGCDKDMWFLEILFYLTALAFLHHFRSVQRMLKEIEDGFKVQQQTGSNLEDRK